MVLYTLSLTDWHTSLEQPEVIHSMSDWHDPPDDHPQNFSGGTAEAFCVELVSSGFISDALDVENDCGIKAKAVTATAATAIGKKNRFKIPLTLFVAGIYFLFYLRFEAM